MSAPDLASRLAIAGLALLAFLIDAAVAPHGVRTVLTRLPAFAVRALAAAAPVLAAALTARGASDVWSAVLGGGLAPGAALSAELLLGAAPSASREPGVDRALPGVLHWMAAAAVLALVPRALALAPGRLTSGSGRWRSWLRVVCSWGGALIAGLCGYLALRTQRELAISLAPYVWWLAAVALCVAAWSAAGRSVGAGGLAAMGKRQVLRIGTAVLLAGALLLAFQMRWDLLAAYASPTVTLSSDAQSYFDEALALAALREQRETNLLALFFDGSTWFREPFFIYLLHVWLTALGPHPQHAALLSIVASLAWIAGSCAALGLLLGRWPALLAAFLLAIDGIWVLNAVNGLREEVTGLLLVGMVAAAFWASGACREYRADLPDSEAGLPLGSSRPGGAPPGEGRVAAAARSMDGPMDGRRSPAQTGRRGVARLTASWLAPLAAAAAVLTRLETLPFVLFVMAWAAVAQRWDSRRLALAALLFVAPLAPTFAGYFRTRGEVAPSSTVIATANWKEEFQDRLGTPGYEIDRRVTAFEYLFSYHTPPQLALYTTQGVARIYREQVFDTLQYRLATFLPWGAQMGHVVRGLVPAVFIAGSLALLAQRRRWRRRWLPVALCLVGVLPPIGFIAGVPQLQLYQSRYAYMVAPFANGVLAWALCAGLGLVTPHVVDTVQKLRARTPAELRTPHVRPR